MGTRGLVKQLLAKALSPIYYSEELAVTNGYIISIEDDRESGPGAVNSENVFTVEQLTERRSRIHPELDFDYMVRFLEEGTDQARVSLQTLEDEHGEITYIGHSTYDAGEFRMPEYGFGGPVSDHVEVSYEWEIAPEFRGRGYSYRGGYGGRLYRLRRGRIGYTGVVRSHNAPSLKASVRQTPTSLNVITGTFRLTRWFGGRWVQAPPWDEVRALMDYIPEDYSPPELPESENDGDVSLN